MNHNKALVIVDEQRCFMPKEEGKRLNVRGFGELAVPNGQNVVCPTNMLSAVALALDKPVMTTQDKHPRYTAHFSETPNSSIHGQDTELLARLAANSTLS